MFELQKTFTFEASHQLEHHAGKCSHLHGHSYTLTLQLRGASLQRSGSAKNMLVDFAEVSEVMKPLLKSHLDHCHLNESLDTDSPTAEFIARWVFERVVKRLPMLESVLVRETASAVAMYRRQACTCMGVGEEMKLTDISDTGSNGHGDMNGGSGR